MIEGLTSICLPTTGRAEQAVRCVARCLETAENWMLEFCCAVDVDRKSVNTLVHFFVGYEGDNLHGWAIPFSDRIQGQPAAWNACLRASRGEFVVFAADDLWWMPGWLDAAMTCMATLPEGGGLVGLNDLHRVRQMRNESTHYLASRRYIVEHQNGCIGFPHYSGACNDSEACARARRAGLYVPCYEAKVEHRHYNHGLRAMDATDQMWFGSKRKSLREFRRRAQLGFPERFRAGDHGGEFEDGGITGVIRPK